MAKKGEQIESYFAFVDKLMVSVLGRPLPGKIRIQAQTEAVRHHVAHFKKLPIRETSVCPYKIASWYAFAPHKIAQTHGVDPSHKILKSVIIAMDGFLRQEGCSLPDSTLSLLWLMAGNHGQPHMEDFAIGPNGLYASFFSAKTAIRP